MCTLVSCFAASLIAVDGASAVDTLPPAQVVELKWICGSLVDRQAYSAPWDQLKPYLRDRHALDAPEVICSFSCNGSLELRGGYHINYIYVNPQKIGHPWKAGDAIVYSVTLSHGSKQVFHREIGPK
jgi:hypothetical protein